MSKINLIKVLIPGCQYHTSWQKKAMRFTLNKVFANGKSSLYTKQHKLFKTSTDDLIFVITINNLNKAMHLAPEIMIDYKEYYRKKQIIKMYQLIDQNNKRNG